MNSITNSDIEIQNNLENKQFNHHIIRLEEYKQVKTHKIVLCIGLIFILTILTCCIFLFSSQFKFLAYILFPYTAILLISHLYKNLPPIICKKKGKSIIGTLTRIERQDKYYMASLLYNYELKTIIIYNFTNFSNLQNYLYKDIKITIWKKTALINL